MGSRSRGQGSSWGPSRVPQGGGSSHRPGSKLGPRTLYSAACEDIPLHGTLIWRLGVGLGLLVMYALYWVNYLLAFGLISFFRKKIIYPLVPLQK